MAMVNDNILQLSIRKVPMLKPLLGLILGIVLSSNVSDYVSELFLFLAIMTALLMQLILLNKKLPFLLQVQGFFSYVFFLLIGFFIHQDSKTFLKSDFFYQLPYRGYLAVIDDQHVEKEKTIRFPVKILYGLDSMGEQIEVRGKAMLTVQKDSLLNAFAYGDLVLLKNTMKVVAGPKNPFEFDYAKYLSLKGIWHQSYLRSDQIKIVDKDKGNIIIAQSLALRERLMDKFSRIMENEEAYDIAVALLFGYRSQIDPSTIQAFKNTGTIHVLSVSGLHVSLVFAFLNIMFFWMDRWRFGRYVRTSIILLFIWLYVVMTGMSPPILRSGIMISFLIVGQLIKRKNLALNSLLTSAFLILIMEPNYLYDIGFQLSYVALLGILIGYPLLKYLFTAGNTYMQWGLDVVYVSLVAQLFTMPFLLFYFGEFPNYFLLANLFIAFPSTMIMYMGVVLSLSPVEFINVWLGKLFEQIILYLVKGLQFIEHLPGALLQGISWNMTLTVLLIFAIVCVVAGLNFRNKILFSVSWILILVTVFGAMYLKHKIYHQSHFRVYNVGKEVAVAYAYGGRCILYTTLDSLQHAVLNYSVHPDLNRLCKSEQLTFIPISSDLKQNYFISLGEKNVFVLEQKIAQLPDSIDVLLWRKNNYTAMQVLQSLSAIPILLLDGSNSDRHILALQDSFINIQSRPYILKNNFAYVWDKEK